MSILKQKTLKKEINLSVIIPCFNEENNILNTIKKVKNVLGKNTISAVRSGFYWGYIGLVENIIDKISKHTKKK